jgi:hypothetical protein
MLAGEPREEPMRARTLLALCLVLGCAGTPNWTRPEATQADYDRDSAQCMNQASGSSLDRGATNRSRVQSDFERCMQARGWTRK